jgi:hypothetical protein
VTSDPTGTPGARRDVTNTEWDWNDENDPFHDAETMVDLGGGMVVPLRELVEDE